MIQDDGSDPHMQPAFVMPVSQIRETVIEFADHQKNLRCVSGTVEFPTHHEVVRDADEIATQFVDVTGLGVIEAKHRTHEKCAVDLIVELPVR